MRNIILITLGALVAIVLAIVVVIAVQPADFRVVRTATINAPPADVFPQVNDFHNWNAWSPWAKLDANVKETFEGPTAGKGAIFKWEGNDKVGKGQMTILESNPNESIKIKLEFIKPYESVCTTNFTFKAKGDKTEVTWDMAGQNDFMGKAMHLFVGLDKMVGGDFEKGLANLNSVVDKK